MLKLVCFVCCVVMMAGAVFAAEGVVDAELRERVAELEGKVEELEKIIEGTAHPINLGRTSLARVIASSVNGDRPMNNKYYGVMNAFDDGDNRHDNINYTYWLSAGEPGPWVELHFDRPVSVASVSVEGAPPFTTRFHFSKGGVKDYPEAEGQVDVDEVIHGVKKVRLTFEQGSGNAKVHEIRILGFVPPGIDYTRGSPRLLVTRRVAEGMAKEVHRSWAERFLSDSSSPRMEERLNSVVFTYRKGSVDILRVTVDKETGQVTIEELAQVVGRKSTIEQQEAGRE